MKGAKRKIINFKDISLLEVVHYNTVPPLLHKQNIRFIDIMYSILCN